MSIDLSQFHQVFYEESFEGLDVMEQELLGLELGNIDRETINTIFRAAHSIKGGSATFNFSKIAEFTHVLETLLDEMREGKRNVTKEAVDLLLKSVDCLREMLTAYQNESDVDDTLASELRQKFQAILDSCDGSTEVSQSVSLPENRSGELVEVSVADDQSDRGDKVWRIFFKPMNYILKTGNEPLRMLREIESLGNIETKCFTNELGELSSTDFEDCFVYWLIKLESDCSEEQIREIFEWVEEDCLLEISLVPAEELDAELASNIVEGDDVNMAADEGDDRLEQVNSGKDSNEVINDSSDKDLVSLQGEDSSDSNETSESSNTQQLSRVQPATAMNKKQAVTKTASSIRVGIDKVDSLINLVGELVITQSMLGEIGGNFSIKRLEKLVEGLAQLEQNTRELQESVMRIRMLPISFTFNRFPRMIRDLAQQLGKKVNLEMQGEHTELDKTVMEQIGDPLVHLVRNSLDHGLELPEDRKDMGKDEEGTISLNAFHQGGKIVIEISDDGKGINRDKVLQKAIEKGIVHPDDELEDEEIYNLIFEAGFSTAELVSDLSGRGVGMDVVRRNIQSLGGTVEVSSEENVGTRFTIRLPLTLAILDGQLVSVGKQTYIIPLISIIESMEIQKNDISYVGGDLELYKLREEYVPVVRVYKEFGIEPESEQLSECILVVVEGGDGKKVGLLVDDLLTQQQVVIKSLENNYRAVEGISGATILGDGKVSFILDIDGLVKKAMSISKQRRKVA